MSTSDARLYLAMLLELSGGHGRAIKDHLGTAGSGLILAIRDRYRSASRSAGGDVADLDSIDLATIRILAPILKATFLDREFRTVTGFAFADLDRLVRTAESNE